MTNDSGRLTIWERFFADNRQKRIQLEFPESIEIETLYEMIKRRFEAASAIAICEENLQAAINNLSPDTPTAPSVSRRRGRKPKSGDFSRPRRRRKPYNSHS